MPLILAAWWNTTADEKRNRLMAHIKYAREHNVLGKIDKYLRTLMPEQWAYGDGTTGWKEWSVKK